ncbi:MAG: uncharacterized protein QOE92_2035 [Chloroflexota bacterium]|jgi:short-subunit dehydrogenase|nr:uncharacterized protein [Chloroflexota bacterium]
MNAASPDRPLALVTGASSGIGAAFARRLARDGYDLIVVARRVERLQDLAEELAPARVEVLAADLGTDEGIASVCSRAASAPLALVVNNAGLAHYMPFVALPPERAAELMRVNAMAPVMVARAALPGMVERGSGTVINLASLLAFSGAAGNPRLPRRAVYAATRAFIVTFTQLLAEELDGTGVRVQALCPGVVETEFHSRQGMDLSHLVAMVPDDVVTASLAGLELGELVCAPTLEDAGAIQEANRASAALLAGTQEFKLADRYR